MSDEYVLMGPGWTELARRREGKALACDASTNPELCAAVAQVLGYEPFIEGGICNIKLPDPEKPKKRYIYGSNARGFTPDLPGSDFADALARIRGMGYEVLFARDLATVLPYAIEQCFILPIGWKSPIDDFVANGNGPSVEVALCDAISDISE